MKKFAGINLECFSYEKSSAFRVKYVRSKLMKTCHEYFVHAPNDTLNLTLNCYESSSSRIIKHLNNYCNLTKIQTLSYTDDMVLTMLLLPDDIADTNDIFIEKVRNIVGSVICNNQSVASIKKVIETKKHQLCFKDSWAESVEFISDRVTKRNLTIAYETLTNIQKMGQHEILAKHLPYIWGMQIVYYMDILNYVLDRLERKELIAIYSLAQKALHDTIQKLLNAPEIVNDASINNEYKLMLFNKSLINSDTSVVPRACFTFKTMC